MIKQRLPAGFTEGKRQLVPEVTFEEVTLFEVAACLGRA